MSLFKTIYKERLPPIIRKGGIVYMFNKLSSDGNGGDDSTASSSSIASHFQKLEDKFRSMGYLWCDLSHRPIDSYEALVKEIRENSPLPPLYSTDDDDDVNENYDAKSDYDNTYSIIIFFFGYGFWDYIYLNEKFMLSYDKLMGIFNKSNLTDLFLFMNCHTKVVPPEITTLRRVEKHNWNKTHFSVNITDNDVDDNGSFFINSLLKTLELVEEEIGNTTTKIQSKYFMYKLNETIEEMNEKQIEYYPKMICCNHNRQNYF